MSKSKIIRVSFNHRVPGILVALNIYIYIYITCPPCYSMFQISNGLIQSIYHLHHAQLLVTWIKYHPVSSMFHHKFMWVFIDCNKFPFSMFIQPSIKLRLFCGIPKGPLGFNPSGHPLFMFTFGACEAIMHQRSLD